MLGGPVEVFSTCPPIRDEGGAYLQKVADAARWSEQAGCRGMLVYADNSQLDAWLVSQTIVENTQALSPLVAVQPAEQFGRHAPVGALGVVFIDDIEEGKLAFGIGPGFLGHGRLFFDQGDVVKAK